MKRQYLMEPVTEDQITKEFLHALETGLLLALDDKRILNTDQCTAALNHLKMQRKGILKSESNS